MELQRILCPVDFSETSRHALEHAVVLARRYQASLAVLYVHRLAIPTYAIGPYATPNTFDPIPLTDAERSEMVEALHDFVAPHRGAGVGIDTLFEEDLDVPGPIVNRAASMGADLIVLGTHGRSGFVRLVLGSVAEKVLRLAACPVLTVPPRAPHAPPAGQLRRIVCAIDFSPSSERGLAYAVSLAQERGARLSVVHVVELPPQVTELGAPDLSAYRTSRFDAARRCLEEAVTAEMQASTAIDQFVLAGTAYREILRLADEQQADLIVLGVHGRSAADLFFFGSTTHHVVREASCPVLTVRHPR